MPPTADRPNYTIEFNVTELDGLFFNFLWPDNETWIVLTLFFGLVGCISAMFNSIRVMNKYGTNVLPPKGRRLWYYTICSGLVFSGEAVVISYYATVTPLFISTEVQVAMLVLLTYPLIVLTIVICVCFPIFSNQVSKNNDDEEQSNNERQITTHQATKEKSNNVRQVITRQTADERCCSASNNHNIGRQRKNYSCITNLLLDIIEIILGIVVAIIFFAVAFALIAGVLASLVGIYILFGLFYHSTYARATIDYIEDTDKKPRIELVDVLACLAPHLVFFSLPQFLLILLNTTWTRDASFYELATHRNDLSIVVSSQKVSYNYALAMYVFFGLECFLVILCVIDFIMEYFGIGPKDTITNQEVEMEQMTSTSSMQSIGGPVKPTLEDANDASSVSLFTDAQLSERFYPEMDLTAGTKLRCSLCKWMGITQNEVLSCGHVLCQRCLHSQFNYRVTRDCPSCGWENTLNS